MGWGPFSSDSQSSNQTTTNTPTENLQTAVQGDIESMISPGAAVVASGGGSIHASPQSTVNQTIDYSGMTGAEVAGVLQGLTDQFTSQQRASMSLGSSLAASVAAQAGQLGDIVAATKTPDATTLTQLLPLLIIVVIAWAFLR